MGLFDLLGSKKTERAVAKGFNLGGYSLTYDLSFDVYYRYYNLNPFVFSVINKRSNEVGARGWVLTKGETIVNEDFKDLIADSTSPTPKEFIKRLVRDYDITGNAYVYIVKEEESREPTGMQILDPRYIKPVCDKFGTLLGYVQNLNGIRVFLPGDIFHIKNDNDIDNEIVGKSRMTSLFIDIESDQEARDSNLAFFKNNQTPSSLIMVDSEYNAGEDGEDLKPIAEKLKLMFEGGKYEGGKNKHRSLLAQGIKGVVKVQDKISDAEFLEMRKFTLDVVASVYEVPKSILGFTDTTNYSNGLTQYDIYFDTIEALEKKFSDYLTDIFKVFDDKYEFKFLTDSIRKLSIKSDVAGSLYKDKGLATLNEAREIIGYDEVPEGGKFFEAKNITIRGEEETKE